MESVEQHNQVLIVTVSSILLSLCFVTFAMRLWARRMAKVHLGADDWSMVAVLVVCTAMSTSDLVGVRFGYGRHSYNLPESDVLSFQINLYIFMLLWAVGTSLVRLSILLFYWRVFAIPTFRRAVLAAGAVVLSAGLAILLVFAFQCSPPSRFWDPTAVGSCIDQLPFYLSGGSINLLEDVSVLVLPMPVLWRLKATVGKKIALSFIFALGGFVCFTSIFRILAVKEIDPTDFTWSNVGGGMWSTVEVEVGCICANLVHLRPIFGQCFGSLRSKTPSNEISAGAGWSRQRGDGFEEGADAPPHRRGGAEQYELDVKDAAGIVVHTELSQDVENAAAAREEKQGQGRLKTNIFGSE